MRFIIRGKFDSTENEQLYWDNNLGWSDRYSATVYGQDELYAIAMPIGTVAIEDLDTFAYYTLNDAYIKFKPEIKSDVIYGKIENALFETQNIPKEFRGPMSLLAYQLGHAYGYNEMWIHLNDIIDAFEEPIKNFENRVKKDLMNHVQAPYRR